MRNHEIIAGKPVFFKKNEVQWISCCDCGLAHLILFRTLKGGHTEVYMYRDDYITEQNRKRRKKK